MDTDQTQNQSPFPANPAPRSGNVGPLAAAVVIVLLIAAGGFYFFYTQEQMENAQAPADAQTATNTGDTTDSLEAELNATETTGSDADIDALNESL